MNAYVHPLDALGEPTRRQIFELLRDGPLPVGVVAEQLPVSRPAVSQHLRVLEDAGLVSYRKVGTRRLYEVDPGGVAELRAWIDDFWSEALARYKVAADTAADREERRG